MAFGILDLIDADRIDLAWHPVLQPEGDEVFHRASKTLSQEVREASAISFHDSCRAQRAKTSRPASGGIDKRYATRQSDLPNSPLDNERVGLVPHNILPMADASVIASVVRGSFVPCMASSGPSSATGTAGGSEFTRKPRSLPNCRCKPF